MNSKVMKLNGTDPLAQEAGDELERLFKENRDDVWAAVSKLPNEEIRIEAEGFFSSMETDD